MSDTDNVDGVVEIRASEIDVEAILGQIRESLHRRREAAQAQGLDFDALAKGVYQEDAERLDAAVYSNLRRLNAVYNRITVKQYVSPRHMPLIGGLVQRARAALHDLVIYYVNTLGSKQILVNETTVRLFNALLAEMEQDAARTRQEMAALQEQLAVLRAQLAELRSKQDQA